MSRVPIFASIGDRTRDIDVRLSYRIVELFSEGLYTSSSKAVEELVANSFDAGALQVHVLLSPNLQDQAATIVVIDDGEGMDAAGLEQHWLIGTSNKRTLATPPKDRKQIGKFGIGKLATYVLASRLSHVSKVDGEYFAASMDYEAIDTRAGREVEPRTPIKIGVRKLTERQAKAAVRQWTESSAFLESRAALFGEGSSDSWTVSIMSSLKPKVGDLKPGRLRWILRTALPLRPDFGIWLNGEKLEPSKKGKGLIRNWVLGRDLKELPKPSPEGIEVLEDMNVPVSSDHRFGLLVPGLGRITGYAEAYRDLLKGKSDDIGRSHGFFVYAYGRLLNVTDGHFGISANKLRHGTFGRFRLVIHMDGLDSALRSSRESVGEGPMLETARDVLTAIFNVVRSELERHDHEEVPGAKLARRVAASPASLSRRPIVDLARAVADGTRQARHLSVPSHDSTAAREDFLRELEERAQQTEAFLTGAAIDFDGSSRESAFVFDTDSGVLRLNGWHPFVATFHDEFSRKDSGPPLEAFAMAEVLGEALLHSIGVGVEAIGEFLVARDELFRQLANESGRKSALSVAQGLLDNVTNPRKFEDSVCDAFDSLGFDVTPFGKRAQPDGVASAYLSADLEGRPRHYKVSLEAKSKKETGAKVRAKDVDLAAVIRHRDRFECDHAVVVGPAFPTGAGDESALGDSIAANRKVEYRGGSYRTITLVNVYDLARLVRIRPLKQLGLARLRSLLEECSLPEESADWIGDVAALEVVKPNYRAIVDAIEDLQREYEREAVKYGSLRIWLGKLDPPIRFETDAELEDLCKGMAQMAPGAIYAGSERVELDQSAENVMSAIDAALQDLPDGDLRDLAERG